MSLPCLRLSSSQQVYTQFITSCHLSPALIFHQLSLCHNLQLHCHGSFVIDLFIFIENANMQRRDTILVLVGGACDLQLVLTLYELLTPAVQSMYVGSTQLRLNSTQELWLGHSILFIHLCFFSDTDLW